MIYQFFQINLHTAFFSKQRWQWRNNHIMTCATNNRTFVQLTPCFSTHYLHFNHFTPKLLRLIFELVRTPNIFSCTKVEMNLVWDNCKIDVTSFAGIYRFDMQFLTIFSSKLSELEISNGSNVWKQTFRGEMVKLSNVLL